MKCNTWQLPAENFRVFHSLVDKIDNSVIINRRNFIGCIISSVAFTAFPIPLAQSKEKIKVVWHGLSFMETCEDDCANLTRTYPNIYNIFNNEENISKIWKALTSKIRAFGKGAQPFDLIIPSGESADVGQPDVGMVLAVTSEADIGSRYYAEEDRSLLIYEIQCYGIIFEFKNFRVMNSFPIRLWRVDTVRGKRNLNTLRKFFFNTLSGQFAGDEVVLPEIFSKKLKDIDFRATDTLSIRVTKVTITKGMKKWVTKQNKTNKELKSLTGNSLTSAISETAKIGIQPFSVNKSLGDLAVTLASSGADAAIFNQLTLREPDLDIRLKLVGVRVKVKNINANKNSYRVTIGAKITIAQYKYDFRESGGSRELIKETLLETILSQNLMAISLEYATGQWRNDWYWVIDLYHALFEWFFSSVLDQEKIPNMAKGYNRRGKTRLFKFKVVTKDKSKFLSEAAILRKKLLT